MLKKIFLCLCVWTSMLYTAMAAPASKEQILQDVSHYLASMKTARGRFIQVGPDGIISDGEFALKRPGKIFFDYAPPTPLKVISDGFWVAVEDKKLQTANRYPLSETPLKILLAEKPNFIGSEYKINVRNENDTLLIDASDPKSPEQGSITLVLTQNPLRLQQWVVTDAQNLKTVVTLQELQMNAPVENRFFFINNDVLKRR
jgi:outer membrane lipoprotein-sorting protein